VKKLRIAFIAPQPFVDIRATPMENLRIARALADAGHVVDVFTYPFGNAPKHADVCVHRCVKPVGVRGVGIGFSLAKLMLDVNLARLAFRFADAGHYDCIHGVEEGAFVAALLGRRTGASVVYDMDSLMSHEIAQSRIGRLPGVTACMQLLERWAIRNSDLVMTISPAMADYVRQVDPLKAVALIPDIPIPQSAGGIDQRHARAQVPYGRVIMYSGSLARYQGLDMLISAMPHVIAQAPDAVLVIVGGDDREARRIIRESRDAGVIHNLMLMGKKEPEEVPGLLSVADVLVSPRRGGINPPAKIYTYMQSGRPIVATRVPAHTAVLDDRMCALAESTPQGIADAILWTLEHPAEARERATRARAAVRDMTPESHAQLILDAYAIIEKRRRIA
jgi:glycosyltransferase involved in cell wall biosynthesis